MSPPLTINQIEILNNEFYKNNNLFGRDKLYKLLRSKYGEDKAPSRRQVMEWIAQQEINQLYRPSKGKAKEIKSSISTPHKVLGIDLMDLQKLEVRGYKYLLNGIDLGSRYLYSVALKNKTEKEVLNGFKKIHKKIPDLKAVRSDNGSEFINKIFVDYLNKNNIKQILSEAGKPQSNGSVERINGVLKDLIQKSIDLNNNYDWVRNLNKLVNNINGTIQATTEETPKELEKAYKEDKKEVLDKAYDKELKKKGSNISKENFEIGDKVRIYQPSDKTRQKWSNEIYEVSKVIKPKKSYSVYEYKLKGLVDRFKDEELQKIKGSQNRINKIEKYVISKLVNPLVYKGVPSYVVKWKGYTETTIEPREVLLKDIPKTVNQYEKREGLKWYKTKEKKTGKVINKFYYDGKTT